MPESSAYMREVERIFREDLPTILGFEVRDSQVRMASLCADCLENGKILLAEAGTGTGKSLAYLLPAMRWKRDHPDDNKPIVVATRTLNLQQQIVDIDIPRLRDKLGFENLRVAQARGRSNYLCLRRLYAAVRQADSLTADVANELQRVRDMVALFREANNGLFAEGEAEAGLGLENYDDGPKEPLVGLRSEFRLRGEIWDMVKCESISCDRQYCRFYNSDCFFQNDRRRLESAEVIFTNHAMVFADANIKAVSDKGTLPVYVNLVLDEAHNIEDTAAANLGHNFNTLGLGRFLNRLSRQMEDRESQGLLTELSQQMEITVRWNDELSRKESCELLENMRDLQIPAILEALDDFSYSLEEQFNSNGNVTRLLMKIPNSAPATGDKAFMSSKYASAQNAPSLCVPDIQSQATLLLDRLAAFCDDVDNLEQMLRDVGDKESASVVQGKVQSLNEQLKQHRDSLRFCLNMDEETWVYWAERDRYSYALKASPLEVGRLLQDVLYRNLHSLIFSSATLAIARSTSFFENRVGLNFCDKLVERVLLPAPFDYAHNTIIGVPFDTLNPTSPAFIEDIAGPLTELISTLGGRTLVLSTSIVALRNLEQLITPVLFKRHIEVLSQACHFRSRSELLNKFRQDEHSVLLGTDSFWEGVDVPGPALSCVVILRLPFGVPDDPLHLARCELLVSEGRNPFYDYAVPSAIVKMRQGFGRLIRTRNDKGMVLILDSRICTKNYGQAFLQALPNSPLRYDSFSALKRACVDLLGIARHNP